MIKKANILNIEHFLIYNNTNLLKKKKKFIVKTNL